MANNSPPDGGWRSAFPALAGSQDPAIHALLREARSVTLPAGTVVFHNGAACRAYLLVVAGSVRVQFTTEAGREVVLYHVGAGDSCVLTTSCLLGTVPYPAEGITDSEVRALSVPAGEFMRTLEASPEFRSFVFGSLGRRFAEVVGRMAEVAFGAIDGRLARALLVAPHPGNGGSLTHQRLATELGTAREVVSRHLKRFEQHGWVRLGRGRIAVLDRTALDRLAAAAPPDG